MTHDNIISTNTIITVSSIPFISTMLTKGGVPDLNTKHTSMYLWANPRQFMFIIENEKIVITLSTVLRASLVKGRNQHFSFLTCEPTKNRKPPPFCFKMAGKPRNRFPGGFRLLTRRRSVCQADPIRELYPAGSPGVPRACPWPL